MSTSPVCLVVLVSHDDLSLPGWDCSPSHLEFTPRKKATSFSQYAFQSLSGAAVLNAGLSVPSPKQKVLESSDAEETVFLTIFGGSPIALHLSN